MPRYLFSIARHHSGLPRRSLTTDIHSSLSQSLKLPSMEVAFRSVLSKRLLLSQRHALWRASTPAVSGNIFLTQHQSSTKRQFTSSRTLTADNSFLNLPSSSGNFGGGNIPPSYFSNRQSLPANTVIRFVPQQTAWIVERMGKFHRILEPGLAILIPFIDRIAYVKSLKEAAIEIPSQNAITADNVTLELDGVLYTRVFDAYKARSVASSKF